MDSLLKRAATPNPTETKLDGRPLDRLAEPDNLRRSTASTGGPTNWHPRSRAEAEPLFRQALEGYRKTQGPDGALTLDLTLDLADLLDQTGRGAEAEPLFRDAPGAAPASDSGPPIPARPVSWPPWA